ncbi:MAG: hypothetical protein E6Q97_18655 [Desulfurellales bacterium]|nr:MAG: hypothetical protein E6Q97_18655 [Desulfurellales bacterium]
MKQPKKIDPALSDFDAAVTAKIDTIDRMVRSVAGRMERTKAIEIALDLAKIRGHSSPSALIKDAETIRAYLEGGVNADR